MKTVVGLYDRMADAAEAVHELEEKGIEEENISVIAADPEGAYARRYRLEEGATSEEAEAAAGGALAGGVAGGLAALLLALVVPGVGPVIAAGPIAAGLAGAGVGAVAGGMLGAIAGAGIPHDKAAYYAEAVRRGGVLVAVSPPHDLLERALHILQRHGPVNIEERVAQWRADGWEGYETQAVPYDAGAPSEEREQFDPSYAAAYEEHAPYYRQHYEANYGVSRAAYADVEPAYRQGYEMARDRRYADFEWDDVEPAARRRWAAEFNDREWKEYREAVRYGYERGARSPIDLSAVAGEERASGTAAVYGDVEPEEGRRSEEERT